jgi:peroxiredoxin
LVAPTRWLDAPWRPGLENPEGWDMIPGVRGVTPQTGSFRDHFAESRGFGVDHLFGRSTRDPDYQCDAAERLNPPFAILTDDPSKLTQAMNWPTFCHQWYDDLKRFTVVINDVTVEHVFRPRVPAGSERECGDRMVTTPRRRA